MILINIKSVTRKCTETHVLTVTYVNILDALGTCMYISKCLRKSPQVRNDVESVQDGRFEVQKNSYIINNV